MPEKIPVTGVKALIVDGQKVLVVKRDEALLLDKYDLPGGRKEKTDLTPEAAILREIKEELGTTEGVTLTLYAVEKPDLEKKLPDNPELHLLDLTLYFFIITGLTQESTLTLQKGEIKDEKWIDKKTAKEMVASGDLLPVVDTQILNYLFSLEQEE